VAIRITADELFFSRIEAKYSPQSRAGYQVVYRTSGINDADSDTIEDRVQCFSGSEVDKRYQFFHLPSGNVAISVSQVLMEINREITDRNGRGGAFITHCYVLDRDAFARVGNDPFLLLEEELVQPTEPERESVFELSVENMVAIQRRNRGPTQLAIAQLRPQPELLPEYMAGWSEDQFVELLKLVDQAEALTAQGNSLTMRSDDPMRLRNVLSLLIHTAPPELRFHCTFDTFVDGCAPRPGELWLLGSEERIRNAKMTQIDLDNATIDNVIMPDDAEADPKVGLFSIWVERYSSAYSLREALKLTPSIHAITLAFAKKSPIEKNNSPVYREALESFLAIHQQEVNRRVATVVIEQVSDKETIMALMPELTGMIGPYRMATAAAQQKIPANVVAKVLYHWLAQQRRDADWKAICEFAQTANYPPLIALASTQMPRAFMTKLFGKPLDKVAQNALVAAQQNAGQWQTILNVLTQSYDVPPIHLIMDETATGVGQHFSQHRTVIETMEPDDLVEFLLALIRHGAAQTLDSYANLVGTLPEKALNKLDKTDGKGGVLPPVFRQELDGRLGKEAPSPFADQPDSYVAKLGDDADVMEGYEEGGVYYAPGTFPYPEDEARYAPPDDHSRFVRPDDDRNIDGGKVDQ
jgi:hypothetical protein